MANFQVPTRENVSAASQQVFDQLEKGLGFVPNIYATLALSPSALPDFLGHANRKSSLKAKEKEVVNLVSSEINGCNYCLSAHTAISKMNGFSEEQIEELRAGSASFDAKLHTLARFSKSIIENRGKPSQNATDEFLASGWTQENVVDVVLLIGEITVTNYLHGITQVAIDFPLAAPLQPEAVNA